MTGEASDIDTALIKMTFRSGRFEQMDDCRCTAFGSAQRLVELAQVSMATDAPVIVSPYWALGHQETEISV